METLTDYCPVCGKWLMYARKCLCQSGEDQTIKKDEVEIYEDLRED